MHEQLLQAVVLNRLEDPKRASFAREARAGRSARRGWLFGGVIRRSRTAAGVAARLAPAR